jgi:phage gp46-like protein
VTNARASGASRSRCRLTRMLDIAVAWDAQLLRFDWLFDGSDLATTDTLQTAVIVSLLTDRLANADDDIPDGTNDRRGWRADMPLPLANAPPAGDLAR